MHHHDHSITSINIIITITSKVSTGWQRNAAFVSITSPLQRPRVPPASPPKVPSLLWKDPPLGFVSPHHLLTLSTPCRRPNLSCHLSLRIIIITFTFTFTHKVEARAKLTVLPPNTIRKKTWGLSPPQEWTWDCECLGSSGNKIWRAVPKYITPAVPNKAIFSWHVVRLSLRISKNWQTERLIKIKIKDCSFLWWSHELWSKYKKKVSVRS